MNQTRDEFNTIQILISLIVLIGIIFAFMTWGMKIWENEPTSEYSFESLLEEPITCDYEIVE